jgi:hypothetical protein
MRDIHEFGAFRERILPHRTLHIFCLGFEERCVAYPKFLYAARWREERHKLLCLVPSDENVSPLLKEEREKHGAAIRKMWPSVDFHSIEVIENKIRSETEPPNSVVIDLSSLPRILIFRVLSALMENWGGKTSYYVAYTYPREYAHGTLQEPAFTVDLAFGDKRFSNEEITDAIMLPGFDVEYTNLVLTYLQASHLTIPTTHWMIPFLGPKYGFYERVLETHIDFISHNRCDLYPQEQLFLAFNTLKDKMSSLSSKRIYIVPLGPRIICVSVLMASLWARNHGVRTNVIVPGTRKFTSIRSRGLSRPLIEDISSLLHSL